MEHRNYSLHSVIINIFTHSLCGFPPFYADSNKELFEIIKKGEFDFPSPYWDEISDLAKDLIKKLLVVEPSERLSAEKILEHPWVVGEKTPRKNLPQLTSKIREFNAKRKFRVKTIKYYIRNLD